MFGLRKKGTLGLKKIDAILTGIVLGGVIAGVFGYRKHKKSKEGKHKGKS